MANGGWLGRAAAIQHIADLAVVPGEEAAKTLAAIEAQPRLTQELLLRRFVEAWLSGQRKEWDHRRKPEKRSWAIACALMKVVRGR